MVCLSGQATLSVEIAPGVFVRGANAPNQTFVVFDEFVVVFDAGSVIEARRLQAEIAEIAGRPVRFVVDSHFHPDHSAGASVFAAAGAMVVAGAGSRASFEGWAKEDFARKVAGSPLDYEGLAYSPPSIYIDDTWTIDDGMQVLELTHVGHGHTSGDLVGWMPGPRVLLPGDLSTNGQHNLANASVAGWIDILERLQDLNPVLVVPGHLEIAGPEILEKSHRYLVELRRQVSEKVDEGKSYEEIIGEIDIPMYEAWSGVAVRDEPTHVLRAYEESGGVFEDASLLTRERAVTLGGVALTMAVIAVMIRRRRVGPPA